MRSTCALMVAGQRARLLCARFAMPEAAFGALQAGLAAGLLEVQALAGHFVGAVHAQGAMGGWRPLPAVRWEQVARVPPKRQPADLQSALTAAPGLEAL